MIILILGSSEDVHAAHLRATLLTEGIDAEYFNTAQFPSQLSLSWQPNTCRGSLVLPSGRHLALEEVRSVFWRSFAGVRIPSVQNPQWQRIAFNDAMSTLRSFMQGSAIHWVNSWQAYQFHKEKPLQLNRAQQLGVTIPATLISNAPEAITQFAQTYEKVIFKPVYGGAHAQLLTPDHLHPQHLKLALRLCPVTLQEYIPGTNIRTYVVGESIYAAEIRSSHLDFREDSQAQLMRVDVPEEIKQQCRAIARAFALEWTAIDWRLRPDGEYVFLEANPSPMFLHFERQTGYPITHSLIQLLLS